MHMKKPKKEGGMGFRDFVALNEALLAKTAWRLIQEEDSLWTQVIKARYFPKDTFMTTKRGHRASWIWSSILEGRRLLSSHSQWLISNGSEVDIWKDNWILGVSGKSLHTHLNLSKPPSGRVSDLIADCHWQFRPLDSSIPRNIMSMIEEISLRYQGQTDRLMWTKRKDENFTVKSGY